MPSLREPLYRIAEVVWGAVPVALRQSPALSELKRRLKAQLLTHDVIYDSHYYAHRSGWARRNAQIIARSLVQTLKPVSIVDVGCATGDLLLAMRDLGVSGVGLEYSRVAVRACHREGLNVRLFDLERYPLPTDLDGDVFVCTEVAEHLPASAADRLVDLVCLATRWVVFTAAPPGQGGVDHVNEQPREYWMEKFNARGFVEDTAMTEALRADWLGSPISDFIPANLMVFSSTR